VSPRATILVADDDEDIMNLVCIRLERAGYECLRARDGGEALSLVFERAPDLCVLDVVMPNRSGFEVVEEMRNDPRTRDVPVIMLTATVQERDRTRSLALGADTYLTKPFNPAELEERIDSLLRPR
jgi:DNA-binding response OmpR family regulator